MISVIVPVLDEEATLGATLDAIAMQGAAHEVLVVDGGSRDRTREVAAAGGALLLTAERGRGVQMNRGAAAAKGGVLLFLHADSRLPARALADIEAALSDPRVAGGGFCKRYDPASRLLALVAEAQNGLRSRLGKRLVGTQALFVRREVFERLGGYREWPLLEDVDFSDRLRRAGGVAVLPGPVVVSARRYRRRGAIRQIAVNLVILALFRLGVSPHWLARLYLGIR